MTDPADAVATPREWVGDQPFPWPPTRGLGEGDEVVACFALTGLSAGRTRNDETFLRLQLTDCYGAVEARLWDDVESALAELRPGTYVGVRGRIEHYHEELQLRVEHVAPVRVELDDLVLFLPRSARSAELMAAELHALISSIVDAPWRALLFALLGPDTETGRGFHLAPAAKQNHHAYLGGLLEHTLSVARVCDLLAAHYGGSIDRDLLLTGALLHDVGKIREIGARSGFPYTDEGKLLGHILLGLQMVADAARHITALPEPRLLLVQHLIASHQGRYEWHSPREPRTLEALILHYADDLDAKLNQAGVLLAAVDHGWTAYDRSLGRDFLRHLDATVPPPTARAPATAPRIRNRATSADAASPVTPAAEPERDAPRADLETLDLFT